MIKLKEENYLKKEEIKNKNSIGKFFYDIDKIRQEKIGEEFDIGGMNRETPVSKFLRNNFDKDIHSYVCHKEVLINDRKDKLILFILKDVLVIADKLESEGLERCDTHMSNSNVTTDSSFFLFIYYYDYEIKENCRNLILKLIRSDNFSTFSNFILQFKTYKDLYLVRHFIDKYKTLTWQNYFESNIPIQRPFIYQNHFFIQKINKRRKQQSRIITFTNQFILNVPFKIACKDSQINFELEKAKWALAIESIKSVNLFKKKPFCIKLIIDKSINTKLVDTYKLKSKGKKEYEFIFYYESDMSRFIFTVRKIFHDLKKVFSVINMT